MNTHPTEDPVERFIAHVEWRFAKTMPRWPHWYVMRPWHPEHDAAFMELVRLIFTEGRDQQWGTGAYERTVRYYYVGDYKYWVTRAWYRSSASFRVGDLTLGDQCAVMLERG